MSQIGNKINTLLNNTNIAAPTITSSLKKIGNGDMLNGIKSIFNFARDEGFSKGRMKGTIIGSIGTPALGGIIYCGNNVVKRVRRKTESQCLHIEMGERIHSELQKVIISNDLHQTKSTLTGGIEDA